MLRKMLQPFYAGMTGVYLLSLLCRACYLVRPILIGNAIEELVTKRSLGWAVIYACLNELLYWCAEMAARYAEIKVFTAMTRHAEQLTVERGLVADKDSSTIQGQTFLAERIVDLFEETFPKIAVECITLVVSLVALAFYGWTLFFLNATIVVVAFGIMPYTLRIIASCAEELHDLKERDTDIFATRSIAKIATQLATYMRVAIRKRNAALLCYLVLDGVGVILVFASIGIVCLCGGNFAAAFAVHRYSANCVGNLEGLARCTQSITRAKDVLRRCAD